MCTCLLRGEGGRRPGPGGPPLPSGASRTSASTASVLQGLDGVRGRVEEFYRDLHAHPELSHQEHRTAAAVAERLRDAGCEVHEGVGGTGVVGVLRNGDAPVVLLRADMDALPVREATGLPYASSVTASSDGSEVPVMHACGHDVHVACLLGAVAVLAGARSDWSGTVVAVFQPAEEVADGSRCTAVARTGVRSCSEHTRTANLEGIERIVNAECTASGSPRPPELERSDRFPVTDNDAGVTARVAAAFADHFGDSAAELPLQTASGDFSDIPTALGVPYTYWGIGGVDPELYRRAEAAGRVSQDIPVNHSAQFAPVVQPTLDTGTAALVVAALAWLGGTTGA